VLARRKKGDISRGLEIERRKRPIGKQKCDARFLGSEPPTQDKKHQIHLKNLKLSAKWKLSEKIYDEWKAIYLKYGRNRVKKLSTKMAELTFLSFFHLRMILRDLGGHVRNKHSFCRHMLSNSP
jgi:hypothetical protein